MKNFLILLFLLLLTNGLTSGLLFANSKYQYHINLCIARYPIKLDDGSRAMRGGVYFEINVQNKCYMNGNQYNFVLKFKDFNSAVLKTRALNKERREKYSYKDENGNITIKKNNEGSVSENTSVKKNSDESDKNNDKNSVKSNSNNSETNSEIGSKNSVNQSSQTAQIPPEPNISENTSQTATSQPVSNSEPEKPDTTKSKIEMQNGIYTRSIPENTSQDANNKDTTSQDSTESTATEE